MNSIMTQSANSCGSFIFLIEKNPDAGLWSTLLKKGDLASPYYPEVLS